MDNQTYESRFTDKLPMWVCIFGVSFMIVFAVLLLVTNKYFDLANCKIQPEVLINLSATFMTVAAAIMLAAQIYVSYSKSSAEKEYEAKIKELKELTKKNNEEIFKKLDLFNAAFDEIAYLKYLNSDTIAAVHKNEGRYIQGMVDVLRKLNLIMEYPKIFENPIGDKNEILGHAIYCIANNLKHYRDDITFRTKSISDLVNVTELWHNDYIRFVSLSSRTEDYKWLLEKVARIDVILTKIKQVTVESNKFDFSFSNDDYGFLDKLAHS